jgi:ABC-type Fe3+-siderophore transport system permease subunit
MLLAELHADPTTVVVQSGVGLGAVLAVVCSWQRNRSILWAFLAGLISWIYVIYFALTRQPDETK